jgi:endonuclease/exonuclease/phosphatase family metal-dependent hydrolase
MARHFRLATFNLENLDADGAGGLTLDERASILRPQLNRLRADILCLQEVNARELPDGSRDVAHLDRLIEGTPYAGFARAVSEGVHGTPLDKHNLVVLSRFPIARVGQVRHDFVPPPSLCRVTGEGAPAEAALAWDRPAQQVTIALDEATRLHLFNLHLRSRLASMIPGAKTGAFSWASAGAWAEGAFHSAVKRTGQALEVRLAVERLFDADHDALIAIAGDLNAEADEVAVEILRADTDNVGNAHLADRALALLHGRGDEASNVSMLFHGRRLRPDQILVSRALLGWYRELEVHNELLHDESVALATQAPSAESYHAPVVAAFERP